MDPAAHPLVERDLEPLFLHRGGRAEAFDRDEAPYLIRIKAGEAQGDIAAQRMRDDGDGGEAKLVHQLRQIINIAGDRIIAGHVPLAVAVTAKIGTDDMPILAQLHRRPVPTARMIAPAMEQDQRRFVGISPVDIMQPRALRNDTLRGRAGQVHTCKLSPRLRDQSTVLGRCGSVRILACRLPKAPIAIAAIAG